MPLLSAADLQQRAARIRLACFDVDGTLTDGRLYFGAEGDSQWAFYAGNYHDYEEDKRRRMGEEAAKPHRIRYKALM